MHYLSRNTFFCKFTCLMLFVFIAATGCAKQENATPVALVAKDYSSEQIFKGVFLLQGEVAGKISFFQPHLQTIVKIKASNPGITLALAKQADDLFKSVQALDPAYPDELKRAVASKNMTIVEEALTKGASLLKSAMLADKRNGKKGNNLHNILAGELKVPEFWSLTYWQCVSLNPFYIVGPPTIVEPNSNILERDLMVKEITMDIL